MAWSRFAAGQGRPLAFIASSSPSGASTVSFDNVFSSTYTTYRAVMSLKAASGTPDLAFRWRASGSDNSTSNYAHSIWGTTFDGGGSVSGNIDSQGGQSQVFVMTQLATNRNFIVVDFSNPYQSERASFVTQSAAHNNGSSNPAGRNVWGAGQIRATTAFDGFSVWPASSTISGQITVYAYAE